MADFPQFSSNDRHEVTPDEWRRLSAWLLRAAENERTNNVWTFASLKMASLGIDTLAEIMEATFDEDDGDG